MPHGKPAGVRCAQLTADEQCAIFGDPSRPAVCGSLRPALTMCGTSRAEALAILGGWERATAPSPTGSR